MAKFRILLVDDSPVLRRALKELLTTNSDEWAICGEAADGINALTKAAELRPDIILLDMAIPLLHGLEVAKSLKRDFAHVHVVIMSEQDPSALSRLAIEAGVRHCIMKSRLGTDLIPVLRSLV
jgi:DNA-binding NarL/FixJ family response regulator